MPNFCTCLFIFLSFIHFLINEFKSIKIPERNLVFKIQVTAYANTSLIIIPIIIPIKFPLKTNVIILQIFFFLQKNSCHCSFVFLSLKHFLISISYKFYWENQNSKSDLEFLKIFPYHHQNPCNCHYLFVSGCYHTFTAQLKKILAPSKKWILTWKNLLCEFQFRLIWALIHIF